MEMGATSIQKKKAALFFPTHKSNVIAENKSIILDLVDHIPCMKYDKLINCFWEQYKQTIHCCLFAKF